MGDHCSVSRLRSFQNARRALVGQRSRVRVVLKNDRRSQALLNLITHGESLETWQLEVYCRAFEMAQAVVRPSLPERDLAGVWN